MIISHEAQYIISTNRKEKSDIFVINRKCFEMIHEYFGNSLTNKNSKLSFSVLQMSYKHTCLTILFYKAS